jgi:hypothetical protein
MLIGQRMLADGGMACGLKIWIERWQLDRIPIASP